MGTALNLIWLKGTKRVRKGGRGKERVRGRGREGEEGRERKGERGREGGREREEREGEREVNKKERLNTHVPILLHIIVII